MAKILHNYELFKVKEANKASATLGGTSRFVLECVKTGVRRAYKIQRITRHKSGLPDKAVVYRVRGERMATVGTFELGHLYIELPRKLAVTSFDGREEAEIKREQIKRFVPNLSDMDFIDFSSTKGLHVTLDQSGSRKPKVYNELHIDWNSEQVPMLLEFLQDSSKYNVFHLGMCGVCGKACENTKTLVVGFGATCCPQDHKRMTELIKVSNNANMITGFRQFLDLQSAIDASFIKKLSNKELYLQIKKNISGKQDSVVQKEGIINSGLTLDMMTCVSILYLQYISELDNMKIFNQILQGSTQYEHEFIMNTLNLL